MSNCARHSTTLLAWGPALLFETAQAGAKLIERDLAGTQKWEYYQ